MGATWPNLQVLFLLSFLFKNHFFFNFLLFRKRSNLIGRLITVWWWMNDRIRFQLLMKKAAITKYRPCPSTHSSRSNTILLILHRRRRIRSSTKHSNDAKTSRLERPEVPRAVKKVYLNLSAVLHFLSVARRSKDPLRPKPKTRLIRKMP